MKDQKQVALATELIKSRSELFVAEDGSAYATIEVDGRLETYDLGSIEFSRFARISVFNECGELLSDRAIRETGEVLKGHAQVQGVVLPVFRRIAGYEGRTYVDLGDQSWAVVEIASSGYKILSAAPRELKFVRSPGMRPLPLPVPGGTIEDFRRFVNLRDESQWYLLSSWLLSALQPRGPYGILVLSGEAGSAKTTLSHMIRDLVDPHVAPLRSLPNSERDLFIAAQNTWLLAIDNVSYLSDSSADSFCRVSTGGGHATRMLYTNAREQFFNVCRPTLFNGIHEFCSRPDFTDRSIQLTLARIPDDQRVRSQDVIAGFTKERPKIFGALLDALAATMSQLPNVKSEKLPRMADFAHFAFAVELAMKWPSGSVAQSWDKMRARSHEAVLESCPYLSVITDLAHRSWEGTATQLMDLLETKLTSGDWQQKGLPKNPAQLSSQLRRLAPALRSRNIDVSCDGKTHGTGSRRVISIRMIGSVEDLIAKARSGRKSQDLSTKVSEYNEDAIHESTH